MTDSSMNPESLKKLLEVAADVQKSTKALNAAIVTLLADIQASLCQLSVAIAAQHSVLRESVPKFEPLYSLGKASPEVLQLKQEYEHRIRALREIANQF